MFQPRPGPAGGGQLAAPEPGDLLGGERVPLLMELEPRRIIDEQALDDGDRRQDDEPRAERGEDPDGPDR